MADGRIFRSSYKKSPDQIATCSQQPQINAQNASRPKTTQINQSPKTKPKTPKEPPSPSAHRINEPTHYSTCTCPARRALLSSHAPLSSLSVVHTQNQLKVSTNAKAKKTRFLRASPPHVEGW